MEVFDETFKQLASLPKEELRKRYDAYLSGNKEYGVPWQWFTAMLDRKLITQETFEYATRANEV